MIIVASILLTMGAASAVDFNIQDDKDDLIPCEKIDIPVTIDGNVMIVGPVSLDAAYLTSTTAIADIGFNLSSSNPVVGVTWATYGSATAIQDGVTLNPAAFGNLLEPTSEEFTGINMPNAAAKKTTGPITIYFTNPVVLSPNSNGYSIAAHVTGLTIPDSATTSLKLGDGECGGGQQQEIPEFPTIALPIAAILGLAFYFQRRKE
jgi:hypothetical protein